MASTFAIVTPVLDDWASFAGLMSEISERFAGSDFRFHVCAVDDGSVEPCAVDDLDLPKGSCIGSVEFIRLAANLGHQRAIAIGLCALAETGEAETILVMDSDGQDRPTDIAALLAASRQRPRHVVFAARAKRSESCAFRLWYGAYRLLFYVLTGQLINFGNFCAIPMTAARRLVHMPELWNNLAASIMRSRLPYCSVPTERGSRSAGHSQMDLVALIAHGLSAMSVYADKIFVRLLLAAGLVGGVVLLTTAAALAVRIATDRAIPGWATTAIGDLLIMLLQTLAIVIAASLTVLAGRSSRPIVPIADCRCFIAGRERRWLDRVPTVVTAVRPAA